MAIPSPGAVLPVCGVSVPFEWQWASCQSWAWPKWSPTSGLAGKRSFGIGPGQAS